MAEQLRVQSVNRTVQVVEGNRLTVYSMGAINLGGGGGVTDHGALSGLGDNDHGAIYYTKTEVNTALSGKEDAGVAAALVDDLSGVTNAPAARTNLGLGTAATANTSAFDAAGTAAGLVDDLSGVTNQTTARSNLGLGTAATSAATDFAAVTGDTFTGEVVFSGTNDRTARFTNSSQITTPSKHTVEIYYAGTTGTTNTALNVVSDNQEMSAMWLSGIESGTGTLKITHRKSTASDANAAAISIDLTGAGTAARGIYIKPTDATTGNLIELRNSSNTTRARFDSTGQFIQQSGNTYLGVSGNVQIGGTSATVGSAADGVIGLQDTTAPTGDTNASAAGIAIYSESGVLKYRSGTNVITLDGSGGATALTGLTDVSISTPSPGQVLKYNGSVWINDTDATGGGGVASLNDIPDVSAPTPTTGDLIRWNGTAWAKHADSNYSASGHTHTGTTISALDAGDTTTGVFDIARIPTGSTGSTVSFGNHVHSGVYQPVDGDLTAIAALAGTSGLLRKTAADTWSLDTATYLTGNQSITVSGDASGTGTTAISLTLANSGVAAGTYNDVATQVRPFTVDAKGRLTGIGTAVNIALNQSASHGSPDTDTATSALHHTLGSGANQAAAGNHTHSKVASVPSATPAGAASQVKLLVGTTDPSTVNGGADVSAGDIWIDTN